MDKMYYLEIACRSQMLSYISGKEINIIKDNIAEKTASQWKDTNGIIDIGHINEVIRMLDKTQRDYRN